MRIHSLCGGALLGLWVSLLFAVSFCHGNDKPLVLEVVGFGECSDCAESNIETTHAFSGLGVTIDCKAANGMFKTRGFGKLDEEGKFKVSLTDQEILEDGKLKEECFAQLHSASAAPCPSHNGLESSKIILKSKTNDGKHTFTPVGKLKFSPITCTSAFLYYGHHHHHHYYLPHPVPVYKKPQPPPVPIYKPKPPVYKPPPIPVYKPKPKPPVYKPPPVPVYKPKPKPKPPVYKPPPVPVYKPKPKPPPVPVYKPKPPVYVHPPIPVYKPIPPIPKKPCPPIPKIPPKHFHHHPIYGGWPPLPPHFPHH